MHDEPSFPNCNTENIVNTKIVEYISIVLHYLNDRRSAERYGV